MNITQLIAQLEKIRDEQGDLEVQANNECGDAILIAEGDVYTYGTAQGQQVVIIDA